MLDFSLLSQTPILFFATGIVAVLVVAISKAGFGGAMGSLSLPIMLLVLSPGMALSVLLPLFLLCDMYVGWKYYRRAVRHIVLLMTLAACIGQLLGWLLFKQINADILMFLIGGLAVFTATRYFWRLSSRLLMPCWRAPRSENCVAKQRALLAGWGWPVLPASSH